MSNIEEIKTDMPAVSEKSMSSKPVVPKNISRKKRNKINDTMGDRVLEWITTGILVILLIIVGYPVIYVVSASISSGADRKSVV